MHIVGVAKTVANDISRLDVDYTFMISEDILKGLEENDYIYG